MLLLRGTTGGMLKVSAVKITAMVGMFRRIRCTRITLFLLLILRSSSTFRQSASGDERKVV